MSLKYNDLQPWVEMLIDALENRGASSSGAKDCLVYPYAEKYRTLLKQIRNRTITEIDIDTQHEQYYNEIMLVTVQRYRLEKLLAAIKFYLQQEI